jgi:hypothetical protein
MKLSTLITIIICLYFIYVSIKSIISHYQNLQNTNSTSDTIILLTSILFCTIIIINNIGKIPIRFSITN